jgi:hypothetical protein
MSEEEEIRLEMESRIIEEIKLCVEKLVDAMDEGDELGVARGRKHYNELQRKIYALSGKQPPASEWGKYVRSY